MDHETQVLTQVTRTLWASDCQHLSVVTVLEEVNGRPTPFHVHRFRLEGPFQASEVFAWCDPERGLRHCFAVLKRAPIDTAADAVKAVHDSGSPPEVQKLIRTMDVHDSRCSGAGCEG